eukprot:scaffold291193_cov39-Tisochrysis_lutea.AAC.1
MGGLAAIELFSWWPIKAYRPCPLAADAGKRYQRSGQTLDEIVFKKNPAGGYYGDDDDDEHSCPLTKAIGLSSWRSMCRCTHPKGFLERQLLLNNIPKSIAMTLLTVPSEPRTKWDGERPNCAWLSIARAINCQVCKGMCTCAHGALCGILKHGTSKFIFAIT